MTCGMGHEHAHEHGYGCHGHGYGGMKKYHHECPVCGMPHGAKGHEGMEGDLVSPRLVKKATKKLLMEKIKAKLDERWGEKLDAIAQELVEMSEEKLKLKKEMWKHKKEMKGRLHDILVEEAGEEE